MALKAFMSAEDWAKLPDPIKVEYAEDKTKAGRYLLQVAAVEGWGLEDVGGLKTALQRERETAGGHAKKLEAYGDLDPVKARDAMAKVVEWGNKEPNEAARQAIADREMRAAEKHKIDLDAKDAKIAESTARLHGFMVQSEAVAALAKHKANVQLLLPHVTSRIKVDIDSKGNPYTKVLDDTGSARVTLRTGSTDLMSVDEFVESLGAQPAFAAAFGGSGASGPGTRGGDGRGGNQFVLSESQARDPAAYRQAREAAAKAGQKVQISTT